MKENLPCIPGQSTLPNDSFSITTVVSYVAVQFLQSEASLTWIHRMKASQMCYQRQTNLNTVHITPQAVMY